MNNTTSTLVIDAFVEQSTDAGRTWHCISVPLNPSYPDHDLDEGPWSVPHAREIGRSIWASWARVDHQEEKHPSNVHKSLRMKLMQRNQPMVRVIDLAHNIVEQWPKTGAP